MSTPTPASTPDLVRSLALDSARDEFALSLTPTGVPGLDSVLGGGLPELSFSLVVGAPGAGKTTLAMQYLFANATVQRPGLFITLLGEPPLKLLRYQRCQTFFDVAKVGTAVRFLNLTEEVLTQDLDAVLARIVAEVDRVQPGFVAIDSFRGMIRSMSAKVSHVAIEDFVQRLAMQLTTWDVTSLLVGEYSDQEMSNNPVFTVADGIIALVQAIDRNSVVRKLQVIKMRGMPIMPGLHTVRITGDGLQVFPRAIEKIRDARDRDARRLSTGIRGLDEMMGGGIPAGDSVVVAGPTGTGKTTFVTQFIAEGIRQGEGCVTAVFEERPAEYLARAKSYGVDLNAAVAQDKLRVIYLRPLDLSVDETFEEIRHAVLDLKASRVVIDSISGFEMALAPTFREDFRESLYRLVNALTSLGVTIVMTVELLGGSDALQFTNFGVSFLTDDIVVQRYAEIEGQLRKVLLIVKMRGSAHSRDFRTYDITASGVELGELLRDYDDILSGTPRLQSRMRLPAYPGLTDKEMLVLESLVRAPDETVASIAQRMHLEAEPLQQILERLVQLGYAVRHVAGRGVEYRALARPFGT